MISTDQDNFCETLSFHRSELLFLQRKQIAFPIDLSPGWTGPFLISLPLNEIHGALVDSKLYYAPSNSGVLTVVSVIDLYK